jgi:hypothetical protein
MSVQHSGGVYFPGKTPPPPPWPSYGGTLSWPFLSLSLCLVKEGFSLEKLRKSSEPITAVRQAIWGNSDARRGFILHCQCNVGGAQLQCTEAFFLSLNSNFLSFKIWPAEEEVQKQLVERKVCLQAKKGVLAGTLPSVTQRLETQLPDLSWGSKGN